jgi:hypothetical protein
MAFNNLCACSPEGFLLAKETTTYTMAAAQWSRGRMEGPQGFKPAGAWPRHRPERTCKDAPTNMNGVQGWSRCRRSLLPLTGVEEHGNMVAKALRRRRLPPLQAGRLQEW